MFDRYYKDNKSSTGENPEETQQKEETKKKLSRLKKVLGFLGLATLAGASYAGYRYVMKKNDDKDAFPDFGSFKLKKIFKKIGHKYSHRVETREAGTGLSERELADKVGVLFKTSDNPNPAPVKSIINALKIKPSGQRIKSIFTYNNGGSGFREYPLNLYPEGIIDLIKQAIDKNASPQGNDLFSLNGIKFRKK